MTNQNLTTRTFPILSPIHRACVSGVVRRCGLLVTSVSAAENNSRVLFSACYCQLDCLAEMDLLFLDVLRAAERVVKGRESMSGSNGAGARLGNLAGCGQRVGVDMSMNDSRLMMNWVMRILARTHGLQDIGYQGSTDRQMRLRRGGASQESQTSQDTDTGQNDI